MNVFTKTGVYRNVTALQRHGELAEIASDAENIDIEMANIMDKIAKCAIEEGSTNVAHLATAGRAKAARLVSDLVVGVGFTGERDGKVYRVDPGGLSFVEVPKRSQSQSSPTAVVDKHGRTL